MRVLVTLAILLGTSLQLHYYVPTILTFSLVLYSRPCTLAYLSSGFDHLAGLFDSTKLMTWTFGCDTILTVSWGWGQGPDEGEEFDGPHLRSADEGAIQVLPPHPRPNVAA